MKKITIEEIASELAHTQQCIIESGFDSSKGCVIGYLFKNKISTPKYIAKIARMVDTGHLMTEYNNIKFLISKMNSDDLLIYLPTIIQYAVLNHHEMLVLKYISGEILSNLSFNLNRNKLIDILDRISRWLINLSKVTQQPMTEVYFNKLIKIPMNNFINCPSNDEALIIKVKQSLEILEENYVNLFTACVHRDFRGENIIINQEKEIYLIDWEGMETRGLPAVDFLHLIISLGLFEKEFILQKLNRFSTEIGLSKKVIASLYIAFLVRRLQENLIQKEKTVHFKQCNLLNILDKMALDFDFRFRF